MCCVISAELEHSPEETNLGSKSNKISNIIFRFYLPGLGIYEIEMDHRNNIHRKQIKR